MKTTIFRAVLELFYEIFLILSIDIVTLVTLSDSRQSSRQMHGIFGRPSIDPVMLIKIPLIQYLYGIKIIRQTIKDMGVNVAYRWFFGLDITDKVPHFSTFGKNYIRRFEDTDLFGQIFTHILEEFTA